MDAVGAVDAPAGLISSSYQFAYWTEMLDILYRCLSVNREFECLFLLLVVYFYRVYIYPLCCFYCRITIFLVLFRLLVIELIPFLSITPLDRVYSLDLALILYGCGSISYLFCIVMYV